MIDSPRQVIRFAFAARPGKAVALCALTFLIGCGGSDVVSPAPPPPPPLPPFTRIVDSVRGAYGLPAMAGAIVTRDGGLVEAAAAGVRRAGFSVPVTVDDRWHIGSNTKAMTAALGAIAVKRGAMTWTTTVTQAFPELAGAIRAEYHDVTLEDLLSHRAGIQRDAPASAYGDALTARDQRDLISAWGLAAPPIGPRGSYSYSNVGYVIAGAMIERALSGTYENLLVSELANPVGATHIVFGPAPAGSSDDPVGHYYQNGLWVPCEGCDNPPGYSSAGRVRLPIGDWARIIQELLKADAGTSTLIDPADGRRLFTAAVAIPGSTDSYGLGWLITFRSWGGRTAAHDGSNTLNHSVAWVGLDTGIALLAATNAADLTTGRTGQALDALVSRMLRYYQEGR